MIGRIEEKELTELIFYLYNGYIIYPDSLCYLGSDLLSLYTAYKYWQDIIKEAWMQILSERYCYIDKIDNDDYKRSALQFCIYRFRIMINESIKKQKTK